jgi:hypothetical protein
LAFWGIASDTTSIVPRTSVSSNSNSASEWISANENGINAVQISARLQPSTGVTSENGLNTLFFKADNLYLPSTLNYLPSGNSTIFVVVKATSQDSFLRRIIAFGTGSSASFTERVRIKGNGNVGIGNTTPQNKLQIGPIHTDVQFVTLRSYSTGNYGENWRGGAAFGGATSTVIIGEASGVASIGGHSSTLNAWTTLAVNQGGNVNIGTSFRVHGDNATPNIRIGSAPDDIGFVNLRSYSTTGTWRGSAAFGGGTAAQTRVVIGKDPGQNHTFKFNILSK